MRTFNFFKYALDDRFSAFCPTAGSIWSDVLPALTLLVALTVALLDLGLLILSLPVLVSLVAVRILLRSVEALS